MTERLPLESPQDRLMRMLRFALLAATLLPGAALAQSHSPAAAIYLRLNGVLPPTGKKSGASE
jgi:hypothetical protein